MVLARLSYMKVNVHDAKSALSDLLRRTEAGEEVIIARAGTPIARLVPYRHQHGPRRLGGWEDRVWIADDFDDTSTEIVDSFYNDESK